MAQEDKSPSRGQSTLMGEREHERVHVSTTICEIKLVVTGGSPTNVVIDIDNFGGLITAYGDNGPEKLKSLRNALGRTVQDWFNQNQANFGLGRGP